MKKSTNSITNDIIEGKKLGQIDTNPENQMHRQMTRMIDSWIDGQKDRRIDRCYQSQKNRKMYTKKEELMFIYIYIEEQIDVYKERRIDICIHCKKNRPMDRKIQEQKDSMLGVLKARKMNRKKNRQM